MADGTWSLAEAKAKFSEVVEKARTEGPQRVTRNGRDAVVVVSAPEWEKRTQTARTLYEFLERSPLKGSGLKLERDPDLGRDVELGRDGRG
ncbi:MAG TPA: type II toxin-antitoxin system Phd/YefM family antitoxin [Caulobacteraceae bacterium]|nr:type II toxin-antitoxin system Phd/YefM family antitoxin [Caulobacteraceae bacterium]